MRMPINCPICGEVMLTQWDQNTEHSSWMIKECRKKLNHRLFFDSINENHDEVERIILFYESDANKHVTWYLDPNSNNTSGSVVISYYMPEDKYVVIPYFTPDFSDYPKLLNKIKTYLTFS